MTLKKHQTFFRIAAAVLVLGSVLINVKNIFTSCQIDAEYQVTMAYRILRGDKMFSQMWEAHQTSAFFLAFFEWFFLKITGSTTGIMIYSNTVGVLCKIAVACCVYKTLQKFTDKKMAFAALIFLLNTYPKDAVLPDFANLQIWFGLLLMCCLIWFFETKHQRWLVFGAVCLCLQVLGYPSCALIWILCMALLWMYSRHKMRDMCIFTGVCGIIGISYLIYFMRGNPRQFLQYLYYIWSGDESHSIGMSAKLAFYGQNLVMLASDMKYIMIVVVCSVLAACICRRIFKNKVWTARKMLDSVFSFFLLFYAIGYLIHLPAEQPTDKYHFFILYFFVESVAWAGRRYLNASEKRAFTVGQFVGIGGFAATLILSDLEIFSSIPYLIPAISVCMLPLGKLYEENAESGIDLKYSIPVALLCALMMFRNFIYLNGWMVIPSNFYEDSIIGVNGMAKYGPLKGIVSIQRTRVADNAYLEWQEMIRDGDHVLIVTYPSINPTVYLYKDVEICVDSTISTPTYSERLLTYWEENPDKYPNVIAIKGYDGPLEQTGYDVIYNWLEKEFPDVQPVHGYFWSYYYLE